MTLITVDTRVEVVISLQLTTLPFRILLTGLINSLDISVKLLWLEILENVNVEEFTCS